MNSLNIQTVDTKRNTSCFSKQSFVQNFKLTGKIIRNLCFVGYLSTGFAQNIDLKVEHIDVKNGLSNNSVLSIIQDQKGYIWFGTETGLNLYDGYKIKVYRHIAGDTASLSGNGIKNLFIDRKGQLWILTNQGINIYDPLKDNFITPDVNSLYATAMTQDNEGFYWIEANNTGLFKISEDYKQQTHYSVLKGINNEVLIEGEINQILVDEDNSLWIASVRYGLIKFNEEEQELVHFINEPGNSKSLSNNEVLEIFFYNEHIWVGTRLGLNTVNLKTYELTRLNNSNTKVNFQEMSINGMSVDFDDRLWISSGNGLYVYDKKSDLFQTFLHSDADPFSLNMDNLTRLVIDKQNTLWVGSRQRGINYSNLNPLPFRHVYRKAELGKNTLSNNFILDIYQDKKDILWVGTDGGGLNRIDRARNNYKVFVKENSGLTENGVLCIYEDSKERLWIGCYNGGLNLYDRKSGVFTNYLNSESFLQGRGHENVMGIAEDRKGDIWVVTNGGGMIYVDLKDKNHRRYSFDPNDSYSINSDYCINIIERSDGKLWLGTYAGISVFDPETENFKNYIHDADDPKTLSNAWVYAIHESKNGAMWIGTSDGLDLYLEDIDGFKSYNIIDGLPNYVITGIVEDDSANLWLSTNKGVSMFHVKNQTFTNYDMSAGLQADEFTRNSYAKGNNGEIFFGGINGFNSFFPGNMNRNKYVPPVYFTNFLISHKQVQIGAEDSPLKNHINATTEIELDYTQSTLSFEFVALNYINSEKNLYAYMMEGLDENWVYGYEKKVTYNRMAPGDYIFRVKASNNSDVWNEQGTSLKIHITPPFWATWWFRFLVAMLTIFTAYSWYQARIRKINRQKVELEKQVTERTKELNERNSDLVKSKKQTDNILNNVKDGLFLLNKDFLIRSQYSKSLEVIFDEQELARKSFIEYLKGKINEKEVKNSKEYIELLFDDSVDYDAISELNPLSPIEFKYNDKGGDSKINKFLTFNFGRILDNNKTEHIIATVNDITDKVQLEKDLKESQEESKRKMEWLLKILNIDPAMLKEFISTAQEEIDNVATVFSETKRTDWTKDLLAQVGRHIHTIKGNAGLLDLDYLAQKAHQAEDEIIELKNKDRITRKNTKKLFGLVNIVQESFNEIKALIDQIGKLNDQLSGNKGYDNQLLPKFLGKLVNRMAKEHDKKVKLIMDNYRGDDIPVENRSLVTDILVQLVRNSLAHGIETISSRKKAGKDEIGKIEISNYIKGDTYVIQFKDDGQGIQLEKLRDKAIETGKWSEMEVKKWDDEKLANIIFLPHLSTTEQAGMTSGRGMGMDIVKSRIEKMNGQIKIKSVKDKYCQFTIEFSKVA